MDRVRVFDRTDCDHWLVSTLIGKRTKRGHSGQSTDRSAAGGKSIAAVATNSDCFYKTHAAEATWCQRVAPPCSRAVRALSAVSALFYESDCQGRTASVLIA